MTSNPNDPHARHNGPVTARLHSRVYAALIGLSAWLVLSLWLFAGGGVADYLLFIVGGFVVVVVALQWILSRVGRNEGAGQPAEPSFHDWAAADFDTWQGRLPGKEAATQILLPIAAVAVGMTIFGLALLFAEHQGPLAPTASYSSGSVVKNNG